MGFNEQLPQMNMDAALSGRIHGLREGAKVGKSTGYEYRHQGAQKSEQGQTRQQQCRGHLEAMQQLTGGSAGQGKGIEAKPTDVQLQSKGQALRPRVQADLEGVTTC